MFSSRTKLKRLLGKLAVTSFALASAISQATPATSDSGVVLLGVCVGGRPDTRAAGEVVKLLRQNGDQAKLAPGSGARGGCADKESLGKLASELRAPRLLQAQVQETDRDNQKYHLTLRLYDSATSKLDELPVDCDGCTADVRNVQLASTASQFLEATERTSTLPTQKSQARKNRAEEAPASNVPMELKDPDLTPLLTSDQPSSTPTTGPMPPTEIVTGFTRRTGSDTEGIRRRKAFTFVFAGLAVVSAGLFIWRATENNKFVGGDCAAPDDIMDTVQNSCVQKTWPTMLETGLPALILPGIATAIWPYAKKDSSSVKPHDDKAAR